MCMVGQDVKRCRSEQITALREALMAKVFEIKHTEDLGRLSPLDAPSEIALSDDCVVKFVQCLAMHRVAQCFERSGEPPADIESAVRELIRQKIKPEWPEPVK